MSYKDPPRDISNLLRALTPEERARPKCRLFHRWVFVDDPGAWAYFQCAKCCDREARKARTLHGPQNNGWLSGEAWDFDKLRLDAMMPPSAASGATTVADYVEPDADAWRGGVALNRVARFLFESVGGKSWADPQMVSQEERSRFFAMARRLLAVGAPMPTLAAAQAIRSARSAEEAAGRLSSQSSSLSEDPC
jgi:hypothetical protein